MDDPYHLKNMFLVLHSHMFFSLFRNGVGKWRALVNDIEFGIYELVRKELNIPPTSFINANGIVKDPDIIITDHMRRRFLILEEAIINEFAEDYYFVCDSLTSFDLYMCVAAEAL